MSASGSDPSYGQARADRPGLIERLRALFGIQGGSVREDIEDALKEADERSLSAQERTLLHNVLALHDLRVRHVMVPRADIIAIADETTLFDLLSTFRTAGHSRLPVFHITLDDPRGMVHIRDFVDHVARAAEIAKLPIVKRAEGAPSPREPDDAGAPFRAFDLSVPLVRTNLLRPVLFAPPSMPALDLLVKMQTSRTHMALVIDEYGGTDGLVSIEDIVEKVVGDIEDEHDLDEKPKIESLNDGTFVADARAELHELLNKIGKQFPESHDLTADESVAGFITRTSGRVPVRGEIIRIDDTLEIEILDGDPRRVKKVRARPLGTTSIHRDQTARSNE
jgi:CBS domain containing-hemolysin-like protein